jgi:hypothetical protein
MQILFISLLVSAVAWDLTLRRMPSAAPPCNPPRVARDRIPVTAVPRWRRSAPPNPRRPMRSTRLPALLAGALLLAAAPLEAQRVATLPARDAVLRAEPRPLFAVGREEGADWEMFSNQLSLVFDADDNLYVLDEQNHRVVTFDRTGRYVRQFGRRGGGPGELLSPAGLVISSAGEVVIPDLAARAYIVFAADGSYLRNVPFVEGAVPMQGTVAHPAGGVVSRTNFMPMMGGRVSSAELSGEVTIPPPALRLVPLSGGEPRTLMEIGEPSTVRRSASPAGGGTVRMTVSRGPTRLFVPRFSWGVLPNGSLAVHRTDAYRIEMIDLQGRVTSVLERPLAPRPVSRRDQDQARAAFRERLTTGEGLRSVNVGGTGGPAPRGLPPEIIEQQVRELEFAETIPTIQAMFADVTGRLWVERPGAVWGEPGGPIDLISPQGRYIGTLNGQRLPAAVSRSGRAAWVERTALDVPRVVVRQLPEEWN